MDDRSVDRLVSLIELQTGYNKQLLDTVLKQKNEERPIRPFISLNINMKSLVMVLTRIAIALENGQMPIELRQDIHKVFTRNTSAER